MSSAKGNKSVPPPDQPARDRIAQELGTTLLVEAAAGTGKTTCMVRRMVALVATDTCQIGKLAAVTFTRKAAAQLRARFQHALEKQAKEEKATSSERSRVASALEQIDRCFIGTIHSFCARLLRERPVEANVGLAFEELDDDDDRRLRSEAWTRYVDHLLARDEPILAELAAVGLHMGQLRGAFLVRAEYPDVPEWPAPAVELECAEVAGVVEALKSYAADMQEIAGRFESAGHDKLMPLYKRIPRMIRQADLSKLPELMRILELCKEGPAIVQKQWPEKGEQAKRECARWNEFCQNKAQPILARWYARRYAVALRAIEPALELYEARKEEAGQLNFQDLLLKASALLSGNPEVRRYFRHRYSHILVDEFQDTDPIQADVLLLLTADDVNEPDWRKCRPRPGSLFVVGDPKQSIYRFRRADIAIYNEVKDIITASGGEVVTLSANFRTISPVVDWVNHTFSQVFPAAATPYAPAYVRLDPCRDDGGSAQLRGLRRLDVGEVHRTKEQVLDYEVDHVTRVIQASCRTEQAVALTPEDRSERDTDEAVPSDFMIIAAKTHNLARYANALERLGIPHQVTGGTALNEVEELRLLSTCVLAALDPDNAVALVAALRSALFGFSDRELYDSLAAFRGAKCRLSFDSSLPAELAGETAERLRSAFELLKECRKLLRTLAPVAAVERIADQHGLVARAAARGAQGGQAGSLGKALELLRRREPELPTTSALAEYLAALVEQTEKYDGLPARPPEVEPVRVINLHKVKGLEAPVVFLADPTGEMKHAASRCIDRSAGGARGYMSISKPSGEPGPRLLAQPECWSAKAEEEQRFQDAERIRLLYVAATRAGSQLLISQKAFRKSENPWDFFAEYFDDRFAPVNLTSQTGETPPAAPVPAEIARDEPELARQRLAERWRGLCAPSYEAVASRVAVGLQPRKRRRRARQAPSSGKAIHELIEAAITRPGYDLVALASSFVRDKKLEPQDEQRAVQAAQGVLASALGGRIRASGMRLVEVPFRRLGKTSDGRPQVEHGVIDLVFREPAGWVLVDFKTHEDAAKEHVRKELIERYACQLEAYASAWRQLSGEAVVEAGLYFTAIQQYERVALGAC